MKKYAYFCIHQEKEPDEVFSNSLLPGKYEDVLKKASISPSGISQIMSSLLKAVDQDQYVIKL
jgi:hypothetical protein